MKIYVRLLFLLTLALLAACKHKPEPPDMVSPTNKCFSAMIPGTPKRVTNRLPDGITGGEIYASDRLIEDQLFMVGYLDMKSLPSNHMSDNLDRVRDNLVGDRDYTLLSETTIQVGGRTGRAMRFKNGKGTILEMRMTLIDLRVYILEVTTAPNAKDDTAAAAAFFDSFQIES